MTVQFAPKLKEKVAEKWLANLRGQLYPGEEIWALAKTNQVRPLMDGLAITNARVMAFSAYDVATTGPKVVLDADRIARFEIVKKMGGKQLHITDHDQTIHQFGAVQEADIDFVSHYVHHLAAAGFPPGLRETLHAQQVATADAAQSRHDGRADVEIIGGPLKDVAWRTIDEHTAPDELPWFVINAGSAGFLAAFDNRLIIAKVGGMAGFMSGSLGGGRVTSFPYSDITNIEYNSGMMTGVLEVLTPSYQGTANHDYWRSSNKGRNKAADDPWTLSNCLPLPKAQHKLALPRLNELQHKIIEYKRPTVHVQHTPGPAAAVTTTSLAEELQAIADLHNQGILDSTEFGAAKQAIIAKHSDR
ncbi:SHOCT domain-containing protein [Rhodococcus opacus]|uniref:SHOCT domain-containing protein n=1 Tax=Rhodococcus opacus TaxID=37919 RepID=UPI001F56DF4A|nr:SHOCT domain-containing protein [Rhodococcus opacus]UNN05024.1 SHOCT domain-containing protein [Rhodococcus opacus]